MNSLGSSSRARLLLLDRRFLNESPLLTIPFDVKLNDLSLYEFSGSSGSVSFLFSPGGTSKNAPDFLWFELTFLEDGFRLNVVASEKEELSF